MTETSELVTKISFKAETSPLDHISEKLESINKKLGVFGAVELAKGIYERAERFGKFAEDLANTSAAAGITTEAFQALAFSAAQSGVSSEELGGAMAKLSRSLYGARTGSQEAIDSFGQLGITPEQIAGFRNTQDAMEGVADAIAKVDDPIKRQALSMQLLGRGSSKLVRYLSKGSASMREMAKAADKAGAVIGGKDLEQLEEAGDNLEMLFLVIKSVSASIAALFAPSIRAATKDVMEFIAANRKFLMISAKKWGDAFLYSLGFVYGVVKTLAQALLDFASDHAELTGKVAEAAAGFLAFSFAMEKVIEPSYKVAENVAAIGKNLTGLLTKDAGKALAQLAGNFAAIAKFAAIISAGAAAAFVIYETFKSVYDLLNGMKWEDTSFGKFMTKIGLGRLGDLSKPLFDLNNGIMPEKKKMGAVGLTEIDPATIKLKGAGLQGAGSNLNDLMAAAQGTMPASIGAAGSMSAPLSVSNSISAPITINAPAGADSKEVARLVQLSMQDTFGRLFSQAELATRDARAH